jgi:penicillin amidase/acyl-homoserine-lactone acylase
MNMMKKVVKFLSVLAGLILVAVIIILWPENVDLSDLGTPGEAYNVRILRDTWGVPHIFGESDADAAFGLAYAHAEDDFLTIQQSLAAARGKMGSIYGLDAAPLDYMVHLLRIWDVVDAGYESELRVDTRKVLEAYAEGLNLFAVLHPDQVLSSDLFPVTGKDLAAASVHKSPLFFGLENTLMDLFSDERKSEISPSPAASNKFFNPTFGSNTFSVGPDRTADGSTFLAVNSHQPWEGPTTWYEAHVHSDEGWDMTGALFPGTPVIIHGHNRNLGWAFTVNHADLVDVYVLDINPDNPNQYRYDGKWLDLEVREAAIKIKLIGRLYWTTKQKVLWSVYGPVIEQPHGTYAVRYAGFGRVDIFEQLYDMNKAKNFQEWRNAMEIGALPTFNVGYADREGNIYYLYNALLPIRAEGYDWSMYLPGNTSNTLWTEYMPFNALPQVLNPPSGFVQNANSSPFQTTRGIGNPDPANYSPTYGIENSMTNRAFRALELFGMDEEITFEEFIAYKYDMAYSLESDFSQMRELLRNSPTPDDPNLKSGIELLRNWDLRTDPENEAAALAILTMKYLLDNQKGISPSSLVEGNIDPSILMDSLGQAIETIKHNFGRLNVPWSQVNRLQRGNLDLGLGGGPDVLHAVYGRLGEDGRFVGYVGDSYVLVVSWNPEGDVKSFSIHQYGSATLGADSPHYDDQSPLFVERKLKPVWFDEVDIRANLESEYRPGEEN